MKVLPSPVRISAILPWWSAMAPISWTSYWRMPMVRFMASRPAANTSGMTSSMAAPRRSFSRLRRALARSRRRSMSGLWSSSSDGSSGSAASRTSARIRSIRSRISSSERASYSGSSSFVRSMSGWIRLSSRSLLSKNRERKRMAG